MTAGILILYLVLLLVVAIPMCQLILMCRHEKMVGKLVGPPIFITEWEFPPLAVMSLMFSSFAIGWILRGLLENLF